MATFEAPSLPPRRRRRPVWPRLLVALLVGVAAAAVGAVLLWPDDDGGTDRTTAAGTTAGASAPAPGPTPTTATDTTSTAPPARLSADSPVLLSGIGAIRAGMTVEEAAAAGRVRLVVEDDTFAPDCVFVGPERGPSGVSFMVTDGTIGRVDVDARGVRTRSGIGIGSTEEEVKATYPGRITVSPHTYTEGGHYLTFVPRDRADADLRIVFETDGRTVTSFRAGRLPDVEYVEGCA